MARLRPARAALARDEVWHALASRGATVAVVPFLGRAGAGGRIGTIELSRADARDGFVEIERRRGRDELACALEAPVWDRYGRFAGQPRIVGTVTWTLSGRRIVIAGRRNAETFEEIVA